MVSKAGSSEYGHSEYRPATVGIWPAAVGAQPATVGVQPATPRAQPASLSLPGGDAVARAAGGPSRRGDGGVAPLAGSYAYSVHP